MVGRAIVKPKVAGTFLTGIFLAASTSVSSGSHAEQAAQSIVLASTTSVEDSGLPRTFCRRSQRTPELKFM
jgi:hypothetical protein